MEEDCDGPLQEGCEAASGSSRDRDLDGRACRGGLGLSPYVLAQVDISEEVEMESDCTNYEE